MKLKNLLMMAAAGLLTASAAQAEHQWDWSMKDRFHYESDAKDVFAGPEFTMDFAGAYAVGRAKFNDTFDKSLRHGDFGASVGANYFLTPNFGIGVDAAGVDNEGAFVDAMSASAILRLPIGHLAPYLFGGGGRIFEGPDSWSAHVGAGLELRLNPRTGIFADGRHVFAARSSQPDVALIRAGLRFAF